MQKKKILIIDDFQPLLEEIFGFLDFEGYKTYKAKDGAEGIQMAVQYIPDLIICDIEMPVMDGYQVYKALEQIPMTNNIPFVFLTARVQSNDIRKGLLLGADDYLTKPVELDELILTVRKRLEKSDRLKKTNEHIYNSILNNPQTGIFIYYLDKFAFVNQKFEEILGYEKNDLNKTDLKEIVLGDTQDIINQICLCLKGIHEKVRLKTSCIDKKKKVVFLDFYGKSIEIEGNNALIGSIVELPAQGNMPAVEFSGESSDIDEIIARLNEMCKEETVKEILDIRQLISLEQDVKKDKVKAKTKLTLREKEIATLICKGHTNNEIAEKLFISNRTVDNHRANLLEKTGTKNTAEFVAFVIVNNLVQINK
jgi:PAS domain S-box-containing protein